MNSLPDSLVTASRTVITTSCCYKLVTPTMPTNLYVSTVSSALTITTPVTGITATITTKYCPYMGASSSSCIASNANSSCTAGINSLTLSPGTSFDFSSAYSKSFTLYANVSGCYVLSYELSGSFSLASYFNSTSPQALYVLASNAVASAPTLSKAQFSSSGSQLQMTFSAATNQGGFSGTFTCSKAVNFTGASSTSCYWSTTKLLVATLTSTSTVVPANNLTLLAGTVKAYCSGSSCSSYPTNSAQTVTIEKPSSPLNPSTSLVYSSTIGNCSDLSVDGSGSTGSGGRSMTYRWAVTSPTGVDTSGITSYLATINTGYGSTVLTLTNSLLRGSATYNVILTLTNFLGSSTSSSTAAVSTSHKDVPIVTLASSSVSVTKSDTISLYASASLSACSSSSSGLTYKWSNSYGLTSTSVDSRAFKVSASSLTAGLTYNFTVNVSDASAATWNTATATVTVSSSSVVASISGGSRTVSTSTSVTLDASGSYDPDYSSSSRRLSTSTGNLGFTWSCIKGGSDYGKSCGLSIDNSSTPSVGTLAAGTYTFTVEAYRESGSGSATATVSIIAKAGSIPTITASAVTGTTKINPSSSYTATAYLTVPVSTSSNYTLTWSNGGTTSFEGGDSLSSAADTSLTKYIKGAYSTATTVPFNLVLSSGSLLTSTSYILRITAKNGNTGISGYAEVAFSTNSVPSSGTLSASPSSGYALITGFKITASNWVTDSDNYPLYYKFTYDGSASSPSTEYVLAYNSQTSYISSARLPAVSKYGGSSLLEPIRCS